MNFMPTLSTLSDDLRLEIVEHFLGSASYYRHQSPRMRRKEEIRLLKLLTLKQLANLDTLGLHHGALDTISLFSCQDLTSISITYGQNDDVLFNPTTISLKRIDIEIDMHNGNFTNLLFDFSNVPEAVISVKATFYVEYKMHVPSAWCRHKPNLQRMFAEDLRGYDVDHVDSCVVMITRRSKKGWKPSNQVHLEGREAELEEERSMQAYYKMRMQQQFGTLSYGN